MFIPLAVDVPMERRPFANWLIVAGMCCIFAWEISNFENPDLIKPYLFTRIFDKGLFTHMWFHAGIFHLIGNMIFLWVFGNAVCYKLGNIFYLPAFIFFGVCAALTFSLYSDAPMLGASGAINGIVGMFLVLFPINDITCLLIIFPFCILYPHPPLLWRFSLSSFWVILIWLVFDIYGAMHGQGMVAYWAHLGGFGSGFILATVLIKTGLLKSHRFEKSLYDLIEERKNPPEAASPSQSYADYITEQDVAEENRSNQYIQPLEPVETSSTEPRTENALLHPPPVDTVVKPKPDFIRFKCPCGMPIKTPIKHAGRTGKCPKCKARITIPSP